MPMAAVFLFSISTNLTTGTLQHKHMGRLLKMDSLVVGQREAQTETSCGREPLFGGP